MIQDTIKVSGAVNAKRYNLQGELVEEIDIQNLVVTVGRNFIASRVKGNTPAIMSHMAVGTNATAAALANTTLGAESARVALDSTGGTGNQVIYTATFGPGVGTATLTEAGLFNAGAAGDMLARTVFAAFAKQADDTVVLTWTVTINS